MITSLFLLLLPSICAFTHTWASTPFLSQRSTSRSNISDLRMSSSNDAAAKQSYSNIFIAGGSRGVGRHIVSTIRESFPDSKITALVRTEEAADELNALGDNVNAVVGDAFDYKTVEGTMDGCDAVISTLGKSANDNPDDEKRIDYEGNSNVIEAAGILGVTRVVLVTSIGCGDSQVAIPTTTYDVLKDALVAKTRAENLLIKYYTNSNWTIIRPGGLKSEPKTGTAVLTTDNNAVGTIHREDVADLVVQVLTSPKTMRMILSAVDPELMDMDKSHFEVFALD